MTTPLDRLKESLADRYRIEQELGQGGMATVYLAYDLRHDRKVAVKVLRPELAAVIGAERFLAEIKTTANLQHPHILPLFDSGQVDGTVFYAMPLIEGESLRERLDRVKQLPMAEAIRIACEVADALDYAHRHGVIHRDIKPENILLHDDRAQVADFGIALAATKTEGGARMTETGMSLGTPHYMSPEQAMGERDLDARTDVYALGCVLYEMLAGEPPFTGPTAQAVVARVMTEEPRALSGQRKTVPPGVEAAVFTALAKLPADRYATAAEFAADLKNPTGTMMRTGFRPVASAGKRGWVVGALVVVAALAVGALVGRSTRASSIGVTDVVRATISLGKEAPVRALGTLRLAVSRDGRRIVYTGGTGPEANLWVREIGGQDPRLLPETEGAFAPFFSPDGESIGFFITKGGGRPEMRVVPIQGGVARTVVADSVSGFGADWADDGNIYFSHANLGIAKVSSGGGAIVQISRPDSSAGVSEHDFPVIVPGNKFALAMLWRGSIGSNRIGLIELKSGTVTDLASGTHVRYAAPGFILIGDAGRNILAARFDPKSGTLKGTPTLMVRGVQVDGGNGTLQFALSATGTLVYQGGGAEGGLTWVARDGSMTPVDTTMKGTHTSFTVSPDGQALAVAQSEAGSEGVWIKQLPTGAFTKLSTDVADANRPVWTPDGRFVAFLGIRDSRRTAWIRRADGSDQTRPVAPGMPEVDEILHHPDGRHLLLRSRGSGPGSRYLMVMEPTVDSLPRDLIRGTADSYEIAISPNGRWLAYVSEESGSAEVYVRPFPNVDSARIAISVGGGVEPLWSRDGTELFYRSSRGDAMATAVSTTTTFSHSQPVLMFSNPGFSVGSYFRGWDVHPDGRFLMSKTEGSNTSELEVILNWTRELERLEVAP